MGYHPGHGRDRPGTRPRTHADHGHDSFRHSYSKDKAQLVRRLSRIEGQVRGIARMIEREEYCVDILQQTAALRAAVDAVSIIVLEDHVQGCVRTAAERGEADQYVDEVVDVVRRTLGRPVRGAPSSELSPRPDPAASAPWTAGACPQLRAAARDFVDNAPLTLARRPPNVRTPPRRTRASGSVVRRGVTGKPGPEPTRTARDRADAAAAGERSTPGAAPGRPGARPQEGALDRPRGPLPTRVSGPPAAPRGVRATPSRRDSEALDLRIARRGAGPPSTAHVRLLLAWTTAINLTAIREPGRGRPPPRRSTAWPRRRSCGRAGSRRCWTSASGGGFPGPPARRRAARRPGAARRLGRQEGPLPRRP